MDTLSIIANVLNIPLTVLINGDMCCPIIKDSEKEYYIPSTCQKCLAFNNEK